MADLIPQHHPVNIEDEMKRSYMDYAMSVIIGRALPDARDGLKPAHRRVLYGMKTMGLSSTRGYRKCAKIVGEVMGNFHPHGDQSIYDTLVRLAQDFNMRNLLVNGSAGIAVGMATNVPPHNLREVIDGCIWLIENTHFAEATARPTRADKLRNLIRLIPAPDFPTGGYIVGRAGAVQAYMTGRGSILMRAKSDVETNKKGDRQAIIVTEIPYQVNKAKLIERI